MHRTILEKIGFYRLPLWLRYIVGAPFFIPLLVKWTLGFLIVVFSHKVMGIGHFLAGNYASAKTCFFELEPGLSPEDFFD